MFYASLGFRPTRENYLGNQMKYKINQVVLSLVFFSVIGGCHSIRDLYWVFWPSSSNLIFTTDEKQSFEYESNLMDNGIQLSIKGCKNVYDFVPGDTMGITLQIHLAYDSLFTGLIFRPENISIWQKNVPLVNKFTDTIEYKQRDYLYVLCFKYNPDTLKSIDTAMNLTSESIKIDLGKMIQHDGQYLNMNPIDAQFREIKRYP